MRPTYLSQFHTIPARHSLVQRDAARNLVALRMLVFERAAAQGLPVPAIDPQAVERRIRRFGAANAAIDTRRTEIEDYVLDLPAERDRLVLFGAAEAPDIARRMALFQARAEDRLSEFYPAGAPLPDHLIHVTCTGYVAPSAAQVAVARGGGRTQVTHAYHMGCYAALPALRAARGLACCGPDARVDIVHTELCSLHFDPTALGAEQLIIQSLFADGFIKYTLGPRPPSMGLAVCALHERILPDSRGLMTWAVGPRQFDMTLSSAVPASITPHLREFVHALIRQAEVPAGAAPIYAVHPGGPRIIEGVEQALALDPSQTLESRQILRHHGNMSSATLPHIWDRIVHNAARGDGDLVISLAFGPGLTLSGGVFRVCRA